MSWIRGRQDAPTLHINILTVSSDLSIQGATGSDYQFIYELSVTHPYPRQFRNENLGENRLGFDVVFSL